MKHLVINSKLEDVSTVGAAVRAFAQACNLNEIQAYQLELCVVEAVNNSIIHAYQNQPGNLVEIEMHKTDGQLEFRVNDYGRSWQQPFTGSMTFEGLSPDKLPESGYGATIISTIMDQVKYTTTGSKNTLCMIKRRD